MQPRGERQAQRARRRVTSGRDGRNEDDDPGTNPKGDAEGGRGKRKPGPEGIRRSAKVAESRGAEAKRRDALEHRETVHRCRGGPPANAWTTTMHDRATAGKKKAEKGGDLSQSGLKEKVTTPELNG